MQSCSRPVSVFSKIAAVHFGEGKYQGVADCATRTFLKAASVFSSEISPLTRSNLLQFFETADF